MTIKIWNFPSFPIASQVYYVPGASAQGGFTSGGAQIVSPEPGGLGFLDITPALQVNEWVIPAYSWLMSKGNGAVLKVRLAPTPQVAFSQYRNGETLIPWDTDLLWSNLQAWDGDESVPFYAAALEGAVVVQIDTTATGPALQIGHVIGHDKYCYLIDEISYAGDIATVTLRTPLRKAIIDADDCLLRPYFTGRILNPADMIASYEATNRGAIQPNKITLVEAIVP